MGLEWFADPSLMGELRDPGLQEVVGYLHRRGWGFIAANLAHELAHIYTPTIKGDPLLARLLEEGRACLVSWLVNPYAGMEGVLPLVGHSLSEYERCRGELLQLLARYMRGEAVVGERELFSPTSHDPVCGLPMTGYYLGFLAVHKLLLGRGVNYVLSMDDAGRVLEDLLEAIA
ncbi:MAG: hypothetical protein GSR73_01675, partial [Desulfurococcales archaeon]|nr:hypothetical protein [Desulfurococcales archaeon]